MENWVGVITTALSIAGALGGTALGVRFGLWKERRLRQEELDRDAHYLAIRVVCKLDPFVIDCCHVVSDWGEEDQDGYSHTRTATPTISFADDVNWKSIKPDLMYRILGLPNELNAAEQTLDSVREHGDGPPGYDDFFEERVFRYGQLGLDAIALADEIRQFYKIPTREFRDWNPKEMLESAVTKIREQRKEAEASHAKFVQTAMA